MGVTFGGVTDEDVGEEGMKSVFWDELYGYKTDGVGRWLLMGLRRGKKGGKKLKGRRGREKEDGEGGDSDDGEGASEAKVVSKEKTRPEGVNDGLDPGDPLLTTPLRRYNAMLAILRNTLYM